MFFLDGERISSRRGHWSGVIIFAAGPLANFITALVIYQSVPEFGEKFLSVLSVVGQLFTGHLGLHQLSGPLGIMNVAGEAAQKGIGRVLQFIAFLSINLGVLNLLPLPVLDGGQILIAMAEGITRRQINMKVRIAAALLCWGLFHPPDLPSDPRRYFSDDRPNLLPQPSRHH